MYPLTYAKIKIPAIREIPIAYSDLYCLKITAKNADEIEMVVLNANVIETYTSEKI